MATLRKKNKLANVTPESQEEYPRNRQSRNTSVFDFNEDYITQISNEIEGRVIKKLSEEFSKTESRIWGALCKLDEFLLILKYEHNLETFPKHPGVQTLKNQEPNGDRSQTDPHPEVGSSVCRFFHSVDSDPDEAPHRS